jgi:replicative DNA helicase
MEAMLLGQILIDNDVYFHNQPQTWWFLSTVHRKIFQTIEDVINAGQAADIINVGQESGMSVDVARLTDLVVSTGNADYVAAEVKRAASLDRLERVSQVIKDELVCRDPDAIIAKIDAELESIMIGTEDFRIMKAGDLLRPLVKIIEERVNNQGKLPGISTGYTDLDGYINGLEADRLYLIGARPSQGKSALMLNIAHNVSKIHKTGIISLESSWREILLREVASMSGINSQKLNSGYFKGDEFKRILDAAGRIYVKELYLYDKPNCKLGEVVAQARRMVKRYGVECLFIDYLQLIQTNDDEDRARVARVSKRIKDLARELHIPIVALAQLRRDTDGRRPTNGDFQHTSQIEQDADVCLLIYHKVIDASGKAVKKAKPDEAGERLEISLLVEKNRDGRTGSIPLTFDPERVRFKESVDKMNKGGL